LAGKELSLILKVMTSPFLTTTLSGIGRCTLIQIGKEFWSEMLGEKCLSYRVRKRQLKV